MGARALALFFSSFGFGLGPVSWVGRLMKQQEQCWRLASHKGGFSMFEPVVSPTMVGGVTLVVGDTGLPRLSSYVRWVSRGKDGS